VVSRFRSIRSVLNLAVNFYTLGGGGGVQLFLLPLGIVELIKYMQ
jgi:hypothetical protein